MEDLHCSMGRVSSMPGSVHPFPEGSKCDRHPRRPAVRRVQGETDSMGCEYHLQCQRCVNKSLAYKAKLGGGDHLGFCSCSKDSPNREQVPLFALRDWEEGSAGPLYYKCWSCRCAWKDAERRDLEAMTSDDDYYNDDSIHDMIDDDEEHDYLDERERFAHESRQEPPRPPVVTYKRRRIISGSI